MSERPRQIRCPRVGTAWMTRARRKPSTAFQKTARKVKTNEKRSTVQNVSEPSRYAKFASPTNVVSRLFSIDR